MRERLGHFEGVTWKPTDHYKVKRPQGVYALWGIIENDRVIPGRDPILSPIWHLFGTDFLSANPSAYLASAAVTPSLALLVENQDVGRVNVMASGGGRKGGLGHPRERGSSGSELTAAFTRMPSA